MYCKYCGNKINADSRFCSLCGKKQLSENTENNLGANYKYYDRPEKIIIEEPNKNLKRPKRSVSFLEAIKNLYVNYTNFSGRAVRTEAWYIYLYNILISLVLTILSVPPEVSYAWSIIHLIPGIALSVRRLHDTGRSASYLWYGFIPIVGPFILIYFYCCDSDYDNQWGLSPYNTITNTEKNFKNQYEGYSAVTKDATHIWLCKCGARISVSPCPFCGKKYNKKVFSEQGLRDYITNEIIEGDKSPVVLNFYQNYLNCIYGTETQDNCIKLLKNIIDECPNFIDSEYVPIMVDTCEKKLLGLNFWRCKGCGEILPLSNQECWCGYKQSKPEEHHPIGEEY